MLLQGLAGDGDEEIVAQYEVSEALLREARKGEDRPRKKKPRKGGVDWSRLRGSPPEAMRDVLKWVRAEYGGIREYCEGP